MKTNTRILLWTAAAVIVLDQISKVMVDKTISIYGSIPIIPGFFNLVHMRNRGMAFGLLNRPGSDLSYYFLLIATLGAVVLLFFWFRSLKDEERSIVIGISLILGGAIGNLIDRIRLREVIDFLDFYVGGLHWPSFNVADSAITVGTCWIVLNMIFKKA